MARSNNDFKDTLEQFDYENLVIIDFTKPSEKQGTLAVRDKWMRNHPGQPVNIIKGDEFLNNKEENKKFFQAAGGYKIVVLAHSSIGKDYIYRSNMDKLDFKQLATALSQVIPDENTVVNLIGCNLGRGIKENPHASSEKSFAAKLHTNLSHLLKRDIPVVARNQIVSVRPYHGGKKLTVSLDITRDDYHKLSPKEQMQIKTSKQPGSKVIFTNEHKLDAYHFLWKRKVLNILRKTSKDTKVQTKKNMLNALLAEIKDMKTNEEIANRLQVELDDKNSALHTHKIAPMGIFINPASYDAIVKLLEEWKNIAESKHTQKLPVKIGK